MADSPIIDMATEIVTDRRAKKQKVVTHDIVGAIMVRLKYSEDDARAAVDSVISGNDNDR